MLRPLALLRGENIAHERLMANGLAPEPAAERTTANCAALASSEVTGRAARWRALAARPIGC